MKKILSFLLMAVVLVACGKKDEPKPEPAKAEGANLMQVPDVGKVEQVPVTAKGMGVTMGAAINDALKTAIAQVNGVKIESTSANLNTYAKATASLDVETSDGTDSIKAKAEAQSQRFAELIVAQSQGLISSFKVLKVMPPSSKGGQFEVEVEAKIAKFKAPADAGKIKIVVAPLHSEKASFDIGGNQVPAQEVLSAIRQQIIDTLSQTGRFTILDRQFEGELQNELDMISSGKTVNTDFAKMGQALSADLVWVGMVNDLSYTKNVRKLQTSDRDLVSYSGSWSVSQRLINLATRQIMQSNTLQGTPPAIAPTTLGAKFDEGSTLKNMQNDIVKKAAEAILLRTFPISIVERDGNNVVLSQGGQSVAENARYRIYLQGKEIKDPQTGQSLGSMESLCCDVVVNRVTPNLSYGVLENVKIDLNVIKPGSLQVREAVSEKDMQKKMASNSAQETQSTRERAATDVSPTVQSSAAGEKKMVKVSAVKEKKETSSDW